MAQTHKQVIGQKGEDLACDYLRQQGFTIFERNYWKPWGEIDLIVRRGGELRFVEVKTVVRAVIREGDYEPEDNIHPWKLKRLRRAIETYLLANDWIDEEDLDWQLDALAIYLSPAGDLLKIEWLEDVGV